MVLLKKNFDGGLAQVVKHLPNKYKALSSKNKGNPRGIFCFPHYPFYMHSLLRKE
jgi:hypothetical protein